MIVPFIFVIRRSLQETAEFLARTHRPGTAEIFKSILLNWRIVLGGMMLVVMTTVSFYLITVYTPTFGRSVLKLTETDCADRDLLRRPVEFHPVADCAARCRTVWAGGRCWWFLPC